MGFKEETTSPTARDCESLPYDEQYALLREQGLTALAAAVAVCRAYKGNTSWIMRWLAMRSPDADGLRERWVERARGENLDRAWRVGWVEAGCFFYASLAHRPEHTVFIRWEEINNIWLQDGRGLLA